MIKYNYAPKSAIGGRKENQDTEGSCMTKFGFLSVVCDGMGGAAGGKTASMMAVNVIMQEVLNSKSNLPAQALLMAIKKANQEIYNRGKHQAEFRGMGTTATALIINDEKATIAHAGDSRVYQLRDGKKVFRTNDHSKVFELVKRGILSEEQARLSEESNIILRALGIASDIEVEINDNIPFLKNDLFMLCTDGVCGALPEEDLLQLLKKEKDINRLSESVIQHIDLLGNQQRGGHDNLTLAFVKPLSDSKLDVIIDMKTKITIYSLAAMVALLAFAVGYLLFNDSSKSQISELKLANEKSANEILKLNMDLKSKSYSYDSILAKYAPNKRASKVNRTPETENPELESLVDQKHHVEDRNPEQIEVKKVVKASTTSELPPGVAKEVSYTVPSDDDFIKNRNIGKRVLIDNHIDSTMENFQLLLKVNINHIPKINWEKKKPGEQFKVYLPKLNP
jgi:serine/threonine protein phosphatase PrpC